MAVFSWLTTLGGVAEAAPDVPPYSGTQPGVSRDRCRPSPPPSSPDIQIIGMQAQPPGASASLLKVTPSPKRCVKLNGGDPIFATLVSR